MFTGIVEELGTVKKIKKGANSAVFTIRAEKILDDLKTGDSVAVNGICLTVTACLEDGFTADVMHIVTKGSVTVDGISLTVAKVSETDFSISAIPHTVKITVLGERKEGDIVNLETDIIGKYVEKLITPVKEQPIKSNITRDFLNKYGF